MHQKTLPGFSSSSAIHQLLAGVYLPWPTTRCFSPGHNYQGVQGEHQLQKHVQSKSQQSILLPKQEVHLQGGRGGGGKGGFLCNQSVLLVRVQSSAATKCYE